MNTGCVSGIVVDIPGRGTFPADVKYSDGRITSIEPIDQSPKSFLLPGFIDAHVHVESSMLVPSEFARAAVVHGTVATVSDPHEIGNVLGVAGVEYMLENAASSPFKFYFGAPSCVPATTFETAGATISVAEVEKLLADPRIVYLSEMMNFPGVLHGDLECLAKIAAAHAVGKPVDGHAPGLRGEDAARYIAAGITTDHECFTKEEALDKLAAGCKISIREGSAARNFAALYSLLGEFPQQTMLCSDDKHPDELEQGHINLLVRRAVEHGINVFDALQAACLNPIDHYQLDVGQLKVGDPADFIEVDSLSKFNVLRTWIDGKLVAENGVTSIPRVEPTVVNQFVATTVEPSAMAVSPDGESLKVIEALDGQLITNCVQHPPKVENRQVVCDTERDVLKLVVVNRYQAAAPAIAFISNFGLKRGAMASSVAHDSHNVIAVGTNDDDLAAAINAVMEAGGGLSAVCDTENQHLVLPLPVAGLMATGTCTEVAAAYQKLDQAVKSWGSPLRAPYMTLSFMALLVIPSLKLSDLGLFDGSRFEFTTLLS
ncbi:adenine deaminase [Bythopirellula polymerisocia]|uniref:Adenine deaminase n=1 Tax=Bythopirellula polymerisocia TaxID=2528003 RepID=A0A5C6C992_9BACT|nr:adenine deaminase [Bythopirellula polymerisocia]TWU21283.1 Adenine deaminase [Bythopirellula polymerisocia]